MNNTVGKKILQAQIPADLFNKFKSKTQLDGRSMTGVVIRLIKTYLKENVK